MPGGDLSRRVIEALAVEKYRSERLTKPQLRHLLGIETSYELDGFLKSHNISIMTRTGSCSTSNTCLAAQLSILTMEAPLSQEVADPRASTGAGSTFQAKTQTSYRRERTVKPSQTIESKND